LSLPLYIIRLRSTNPPSNAWELLALAVAFLLVIRACADRTLKRRFRRISAILKDIAIPAGLLFIGIVTSTAFSGFQRISMGIVKGWFIIPFLLFLVILLYIECEKDTLTLMHMLVLSSCAVGAVAFYYMLQGEFTYDGRLRAFYLSPNFLAMYLAPVIVLMAAYCMHEKKRWLAVIYYAGLALVLPPFLLTKSLGAWIAVIIGISILWAAAVFPRKHVRILTAAAISAIFFSIAIPFFVEGPLVRNSLIRETGSTASRIAIWRSARELIERHPLFGIGPGMFQDAYLSLQNHFPPYLDRNVPHPHNLFFAFWLESGLMGAVGFYLLSLTFIKTKAATEWWWITLPVIVILVYGIIDTPYWKNDLAGQFWVLLALGFALANTKKE